MAAVSHLVAEARSYSSWNNVRLASTAEVIRELSRAQRELFARAPVRFLARTDVTPPGAGAPWVLPHRAPVYYIETGGVRVYFGPKLNRDALLEPAVWYEGRAYYASGSTPSPASDTLRFTHGKTPAVLVPGADTDEDLPEAHDRILVLAAVRYLALKDQREAEYAALTAEYDRMLAGFDAESAAWLAEGVY